MDDVVEVVDDKTLDARLDESIRENLREIQARETVDPDTPDTPASTDKPRASDGTFVAKAPTEAAAGTEVGATAPIDGAAPAPAAAAAATGELAQAADLNRPPSSWKPAAKAAWAALPEIVRADIHRREFDFHNATFKGPLKENADFGQSIRTTLEPYRAMIDAEGGTPERAVADLMRTAALFRTGSADAKRDALFQIDRQFNCGLNAHFAQAVEAEVAKRTGQPAPAGQPAPSAQQQTFQDPRVDTILASFKAQEDERRREAEASNSAVVNDFVNAKAADGQPLYPFVDNVSADMSARVPMLRQQNPALSPADVLKMAYEQAAWANPEVRAVLIAQQTAASSAPAESLRRVTRAKAVVAATMPKNGAIAARAPEAVLKFGTPESDESIRATYRELQGQS